MFIFWACVFICAGLAIWEAIGDGADGFAECFVIIAGGVALGVMIGGIMSLVVSIITPVDKSRIVKDNERIVSIVKGSSVQGDFVLGCGSIEGKMHYYFYRDAGDDCYFLGNVSASDTIIKETKEVPSFTEYEKYSDPRPWSFVLVHEHSYLIKVPKNTIIREFKL